MGFQKFLPPPQSLMVFAARNYAELSPWHWNLGLGVLVQGWDSLLPRYLSQIFIQHTWMWDQPILHVCPSYHLDGCHFFNSMVIRLLFNLI